MMHQNNFGSYGYGLYRIFFTDKCRASRVRRPLTIQLLSGEDLPWGKIRGRDRHKL